MSARERLSRIVEQPVADARRPDFGAGTRARNGLAPSEGPAKPGQADPLASLMRYLTQDEVRTAYAIRRLVAATPQGGRPIVTPYGAGPLSRAGSEPEISDSVAEGITRLRRAFRAMGPDGPQAVIGRLCYGESWWPDAVVVAALRAASPILLEQDADWVPPDGGG